MAIALEQTVQGGVDTGNITLTSWTPGSNELVLVAIAQRDETITPSLSGNGLTFVQVIDQNDSQAQTGVVVFRAMGSSPTTGSITITLTGNTVPAYAIASRFSGVDTTGTNGSGACEASAGAETGAVDNGNITVNITTVTNNAWAYGAVATHGSGTLTLVDETSITINNSQGSAGNLITAHAFYQSVATAGSTTLLGSSSFSAAREWAIAAISIKPASGTAYNQAAAGTLTSSGALLKTTKKVLAGTMTSAGAVIKQTAKALAGTLTSSGALTAFKLTVKVLAGTLTSAGALVKKPIKPLAGTLTSSGALLKRANKILVGTLTSSGVLTKVKVVIKVLAGTLTSSGALTRRTIKALAGTLTSSGVTLALRLGGILLTLPERTRSLTVRAKQGLTVSVRNLLTLGRK